LDHRVELELRGIPAQAWHISTAEHILGNGCWIEQLHPRTRSRADLATFRLTARTSDPRCIRRRAVLEIVELIPARQHTDPPTLRTLKYPIAIRRADPIDADAATPPVHPTAGDDNANGGRDGADHGNDSTRHGRQRRRGRGRKRRCSSSAQDGRADGVVVDSAGWTGASHTLRTDGVTVDDSWGQGCRSRPGPDKLRSLDPCPGQRGPRRPRRRAKKGKRRERQSGGQGIDGTGQAVDLSVPSPTGSASCCVGQWPIDIHVWSPAHERGSGTVPVA
jgi:hypothetical protein